MTSIRISAGRNDGQNDTPFFLGAAPVVEADPGRVRPLGGDGLLGGDGRGRDRVRARLFFRTPPLREKSALQEAADQDAAMSAQRAAREMGALVEPDLVTTGSIRTVPGDDRR